jgi:hypothetical protein
MNDHRGDGAAALAELCAAYPVYRFFAEVRPGSRPSYTAQRTDGQPGLHTIVTGDLAELREVLAAAEECPPDDAGMSSSELVTNERGTHRKSGTPSPSSRSQP